MTMEPITRPCWYCKEPCDPQHPRTLQLVKGWAERRTAGGVNQVRMAQKQHLFAHKECVDLASRRSYNPQQETMFPEDT